MLLKKPNCQDPIWLHSVKISSEELHEKRALYQHDQTFYLLSHVSGSPTIADLPPGIGATPQGVKPGLHFYDGKNAMVVAVAQREFDWWVVLFEDITRGVFELKALPYDQFLKGAN